MSYDTDLMKSRLNRAFRKMRTAGLLAKQDHLCCQSCGGADLANQAVKLIQDKKRTKDQIKGCCFYHHQDKADLVRGETFYLAYGSLETSDFGQIGIATKEVGEIVKKILEQENIIVDWNGSESSRIAVTGLK